VGFVAAMIGSINRSFIIQAGYAETGQLPNECSTLALLFLKAKLIARVNGQKMRIQMATLTVSAINCGRLMPFLLRLWLHSLSMNFSTRAHAVYRRPISDHGPIGISAVSTNRQSTTLNDPNPR